MEEQGRAASDLPDDEAAATIPEPDPASLPPKPPVDLPDEPDEYEPPEEEDVVTDDEFIHDQAALADPTIDDQEDDRG
jgi:hypothetical protein